MSTLATVTWRAAIAGRWIARIAGTLMALFFLAFLFGEGPPPLFRLGWHQNLQFLGMAGLFAGLLAAWKWEAGGALVALASYALLLSIDRRFNTTWFFLIPAAVAVLHILCWARIFAGPPASDRWEFPKRALWIGAGALGVFLALCANEIFGNPPLMTPQLRPSAALIGDWHAKLPTGMDVALTIHDDASVTGTIGEAPLSTGRIVYGRTWFGRWMNWRSPYQLLGTLANQRCTGVFEWNGETLQGSLFLSDQPFGVQLTKRVAP
jgi:hypothetical protein